MRQGRPPITHTEHTHTHTRKKRTHREHAQGIHTYTHTYGHTNDQPSSHSTPQPNIHIEIHTETQRHTELTRGQSHTYRDQAYALRPLFSLTPLLIHTDQALARTHTNKHTRIVSSALTHTHCPSTMPFSSTLLHTHALSHTHIHTICRTFGRGLWQAYEYDGYGVITLYNCASRSSTTLRHLTSSPAALLSRLTLYRPLTPPLPPSPSPQTTSTTATATRRTPSAARATPPLPPTSTRCSPRPTTSPSCATAATTPTTGASAAAPSQV